METTIPTPSKLVSARGLIAALFAEGSRPNVRWVYQQAESKTFPSRRIGGRLFFDVSEVRAFIDANLKLEARRAR